MTWIRTPTQRLVVLFAAVLVVAAATAMAVEVPRLGPEVVFELQPRFQYAVERDGVVVGFFSECSGIGSEQEVVEFREGGDPAAPVRKLPGRVKWGDVTLKRGLSSDLLAWSWREEVIAGAEGFRSQVTIRMLNREGTPVAGWSFENAWPSKVSGPQLSSDAGRVGIEELVLVHEGMNRVF
jgi:phage tail-like protein